MKLKNLYLMSLVTYALSETNTVHGALVPALTLQYFFGKTDTPILPAEPLPELNIPEEKKQKIRELFKAHGFPEVHFANWGSVDDSKTNPNMSMSTENKIPLLRMNSAAQTVYRQDNPKILFTPDEMDTTVHHELGHAIHDHSNKIHPMPVDLNIIISTMGSVCIGLWVWQKLSGNEKQAPLAFLSGLGCFMPQLLTYDLLNNPFRQRQEREADQFVLKLGNKKLIESRISFFEKIIKKNEKKSLIERITPTWTSTHPTPEERIATAKKALEELKSAAAHDELRRDIDPKTDLEVEASKAS